MSQNQFLSKGSEQAIADGAKRLLAGGLVAFATETVYGLGADACNAEAVARIYQVKGRPSDHPLIVHISSMNQLEQWARDIPEYAIALARDFWPGPMTLVLLRSKLAADFITGGQDTIGLRVPDHAVALALLEAFEKIGGKGVAAPSANRFGQVSPTNVAAVIDEIGEYLNADDQIIDGGACAVGVESTIIDCTGQAPRILRPGAVSVAMIQECTALEVLTASGSITDSLDDMTVNNQDAIRVSGSLESHYAPIAKVFLDQIPTTGQGFVALANKETPAGVIRLASPQNDEEFAQSLYAALREADAQGLAEVVVMQPIGIGIAVAIRDRLRRAANGR